jgi:hypothetical protein
VINALGRVLQLWPDTRQLHNALPERSGVERRKASAFESAGEAGKGRASGRNEREVPLGQT